EEFLQYAQERGVKATEADLKTSGNELKFYLKAMILRLITNNDTYFKYINGRDVEIGEALKLLRSQAVPDSAGGTRRQTGQE
ncbi:MAG: hypothetical protein KIG28_04575, partial [Bacteroidales bacterium]|nr:hypothetical protein [Bacteroidales bacterium]